MDEHAIGHPEAHATWQKSPRSCRASTRSQYLTGAAMAIPESPTVGERHVNYSFSSDGSGSGGETRHFAHEQFRYTGSRHRRPRCTSPCLDHPESQGSRKEKDV
jgi:hypothetical protein